MSKLVPPHGSPELKPLLLEGQAKTEEIKKAQQLKKIPLTDSPEEERREKDATCEHVL
jgi:hypothetical protein